MAISVSPSTNRVILAYFTKAGVISTVSGTISYTLVGSDGATVASGTLTASGSYYPYTFNQAAGVYQLVVTTTDNTADYLTWIEDIEAIAAGGGATAQEVWEYTTRTLTSGVNLGAVEVTLTDPETYVSRLNLTIYKRVDYVTGGRAGPLRFRYNVNLSGATVKLIGEYRGLESGTAINITGSAAVDPDDSDYYIVEFSVPTSTSDGWGTGDKVYLYEIRSYKTSIDDVLQRGWITVPDGPAVAAN